MVISTVSQKRDLISKSLFYGRDVSVAKGNTYTGMGQIESCWKMADDETQVIETTR